jgi:hypothetical protein
MLHPKISLFLAIFSYTFLLWLITNNHFYKKKYQSSSLLKPLDNLVIIKINQNTHSLNNLANKTIANNFVTPKNNSPQQPSNIDKNINNNSNIERKILHQPLPHIPQDLRYDLLNETIIANFSIDENGKVLEIKLISPSKNLKLNSLLREKLQEWIFTTHTKITSQNVEVNFIVTDTISDN